MRQEEVVMKLVCTHVESENNLFTEGREYPVLHKEGLAATFYAVLDDTGAERLVPYSTARFIIRNDIDVIRGTGAVFYAHFAVVKGD